MGKRGELKPHASWKGERTRVGLASRKRTKEKGGKIMKVSKTFKRFAICSEAIGLILIILGLAIQGVSYDYAVPLYVLGFVLILLPIGWFLRSIPQPI